MAGGGFETASGWWLLASGGAVARAEGGGTGCDWEGRGRNVEDGAKAGTEDVRGASTGDEDWEAETEETELGVAEDKDAGEGCGGKGRVYANVGEGS